MTNVYFRRHLVFVLKIVAVCLFMPAVFQAQPENAAAESLKSLFEEFKAAKNLPCGARQEAIRVGKDILAKHGRDELNRDLIAYVKNQTELLEKQEIACKNEFSLENLFEKFKAASRAECGGRGDAIGIGEIILDRHTDDKLNSDVIAFVKKRIELFEKEDPVCRRENAYIEAFRSKNWHNVLTIGKLIIDAEGDTPKALDVMIDLAQTGYELTAYEKDNSYNIETIDYALRAVELIEKGVRTNGGWGALTNFKNREKTLGWLNYIAGYISYFRLKGDKKALPYFYKAAKYRMEFKNDAFIYHAVAVYYFDRRAVLASGLDIVAFINRAQSLTDQNAAPGRDYFVQSEEELEIARLYKNLVDLYELRYGLAPDENVSGLPNYIHILINRPLIDPAAGITRKK